MRLGTANIKNYPDMPRAKVAADGKKMGSVSDVWGQQENNPGEDNPAIRAALGPDWSIVHGDTDLPVYFKRAMFDVVGARVHEMPFHPVLPLTPRPRLLTGTTLKLANRPGVPAFVVVNLHLIAGAYVGDNAPSDTKRRKRQWNIEFDHLHRFVHQYRTKGFTVFVLGDFNHPRPPKPIPNFQWLVGSSLDRIGVSSYGLTDVEEIDDGVVQLNSDHNGQWTRVLLA